MWGGGGGGGGGGGEGGGGGSICMHLVHVHLRRLDTPGVGWGGYFYDFKFVFCTSVPF